MFKKVKKFWGKVENYIFLIVTFILFSLLGYAIFIYFKDFDLFRNSTLNLIILVIVYITILLSIINLYFKIIKFLFIKPNLDEKEFRKLWSKRYKILKKLIGKKENAQNRKKFAEAKKINEKINSNSVSFKIWLMFLAFSVYMGIYLGNPFWAIKNSFRRFGLVVKDSFLLRHKYYEFRWYKVNDEKYFIQAHIPKY